MSATTTDTTCRGCSLLCDDLTISISGQELILCENACSTAEKWFQSALHLEDKKQNTEEAIITAKKWLQEAGSTLICGLEGLTLQAETDLINLARKAEAFLSAGTSSEKIASYQRYGGSSCTLGEVRQRADFILVGNVDLLSTWPRFEQQILSKSSRFLSSDKPRQLVFLGDASLLEEASRYSEVIDVPQAQLDQAILLLRRFCKNQSWKIDSREKAEANHTLTSKAIKQIQQLAEQLLNAEYPVLFHDDSLAEKNFLWVKLISEVNQKSRLHSLTVSAEQAQGAVSETILAMTGFPDHIVFRNEEILHDGQRFQAARLIENREVDLVIFAGDLLSEKWLEALQSLTPAARLVVIHSGRIKLSQIDVPLIEILTQVPGIHEAGTAMRCDGVPLPLRSVISSRLSTVSGVVKSILQDK